MRPEARLEEALSELGALVAVPPEPDLAPAVRARIEAAPARRRRFGLHPWLWTRRSIALAAALFVLASGIAVGAYFGVRGVEIRIQPTPSPTPTVSFAVGGQLGLGGPTSLAEVATLVSFPVRFPSALGAPDEIYITRRIEGGGVWMLYRPRPGLSESKATEAGLVLLQFRGSFTRESMRKLVDEGQLREVTVGGARGLWVEGAHTVGYVDSRGQFVQDTLRIADNTLLWQVGSVTFRLESALSLEESVRIAESIT